MSKRCFGGYEAQRSVCPVRGYISAHISMLSFRRPPGYEGTALVARRRIIFRSALELSRSVFALRRHDARQTRTMDSPSVLYGTSCPVSCGL